jgi:hypothetical protein
LLIFDHRLSWLVVACIAVLTRSVAVTRVSCRVVVGLIMMGRRSGVRVVGAGGRIGVVRSRGGWLFGMDVGSGGICWMLLMEGRMTVVILSL